MVARGHPAKRGSAIDSPRSAGDGLVSIGEGVSMGFNQHWKYPRSEMEDFHFPADALPIPYVLTDFGRAQLALWRAREAREAEAAAAQTSTETPLPRQ